MNQEEAKNVVSYLRAAFPQQTVPEATFRLYCKELGEFDYAATMNAARELIRTETFFPTLARLRRCLVERQLALPSALEAWENINQAVFRDGEYAALHPIAKRSLTAMGGSSALRTSERPEIFRSQFFRLYEEACRDAINRGLLGRAAQELPAANRAALPAPEETSTPLPVAAARLRAMKQALIGENSWDEVNLGDDA